MSLDWMRADQREAQQSGNAHCSQIVDRHPRNGFGDLLSSRKISQRSLQQMHAAHSLRR